MLMQTQMDQVNVLLKKTTTPFMDMGSDASDETRITAPKFKLTGLSE
jgi:hypothetical protein